jgi:hypothetical protein
MGIEAEYLDSNEWLFEDFEDKDNIGIPRNERNEISYIDPKYENIKHDFTTKKGKSYFCEQRHKIHHERFLNFEKDRLETLIIMTDKQCFVRCKNCKGGFIAKKADRNRGWGKYCSKSCKAQAQN